MKSTARMAAAWCATVLLICACASGPDRFYALQPVPAAASDARHQFAAEFSLRISVPSVMDRSQLVLDRGASIQVLEHERWASPLSDQLATALSQDLEQRRPDLLMTSRPLSQSTTLPRFALQVEMVSLLLRKEGSVTVEARWRIDPPGGKPPRVGRETFTTVPSSGAPAALASALSQCVADLAERLTSEMSNS